MSKIICDICGTTYQDTAECCPICGCARDAAADLLGEELIEEEILEEPKNKGGRFAPKKKEIFDYDEVNEEDEEEDEDEEDDEDFDEEEEEEEAPRHNTLVVILLTILIAGLLVAAGFIFFRYYWMNNQVQGAPPPTTTVVQTEAAVEEATIPCEAMSMLSAGVAQLSAEGQQFLIHIQVKPETTTDRIIYTSGNDAVATVSEDGRITAVAEGETTIYISCGKVSMECPVVVKYVEETLLATTEAQATEATAAEEAAEVPAEPQATEPVAADPPVQEETVPETTVSLPADYDPNVVLKLKKTDIMLGVYYYVTLQLDCDLDPTQVQWSSEHPHIAKVDEKGVVTALKAGTTDIVAKYGDQVVKCRVRCG